jgi:NitT/TauT family transport system substrate-binding protein
LRIAILSLLWLILISALHYRLNIYEGSRQVLTMGYMPVISNLSAPLLDYASRNGEGIRFKALKFSSFAEMAEALRNNEIQTAFIIAPLAILLKQQGVDVKIVYIGNQNESTLVVRKGLHAEQLSDLRGRTIAIPMRYSGHNLALLQQLQKEGLSQDIHIVEMNPPDMASALFTGALDAYFVGEPFAAQTIRSGEAEKLYFAEEFCPDFICNLLITRQSVIDEDKASITQLVQGAVRAGIWACGHPDEAAAIVSTYWNQPEDLIIHALTTPAGRIEYNKYIPRQSEIQRMADLMVRFNLLEDNDIIGIVDDEFTLHVSKEDVAAVEDIFR